MSVRLAIEITNDVGETVNVIKNVTNEAIKRKGKLTPIQVSYVANEMTRAVHRYINSIQFQTGKPHRFIATRWLETKGSRVVKLGNTGTTYSFGLEMEKYGYILGADEFNFVPSKAVEKRLVSWIRTKMGLGVYFFTRIYFKNGTYKDKPITKPYEFRRIAWAIMFGGIGHTEPMWYVKSLTFSNNWETGNPYLKEIWKRLVATGNLIPAISKKVSDEITKLSKND